MLNKVYLDNAATSRYKPFCVYTSYVSALRRSANSGRGGHNDSIRAGLYLEDARDAVRKLLNCDGNVILTKNCTEALNIAIIGSAPRGEVITSVYEHNSVLRPLLMLEREGKIIIKYVYPEDGIIRAKSVAKLMSKKTVMVVINEKSNVTGYRSEIEKIAEYTKASGVRFLVDGAQALGHTYADYGNVDMLAGSGHKGLHSPQGTGFLYVKKGIILNPIIYGGTGTDSKNPYQPQEVPDGFESGTQNAPAFYAMAKGIYWTIFNKDKINDKITNLSKELYDGLSNIKGVNLYSERESGIVSFTIKNVPSAEAGDILNNKFNIAVRAGFHCAPLAHQELKTYEQGIIRASVGFNNNKSDIYKLIEAIKTL